MVDDESTIKPRLSVRRFDILAEYTRQQRIDKGDPPDVAKGFGVWRAKWVASGAGRKKKSEGQPLDSVPQEKPEEPESKWRTLDGKEQTDQEFDKAVIDHVGEVFYEQVMVPAIELARKQKLSYEKIRDSIREDWQLPKASR